MQLNNQGCVVASDRHAEKIELEARESLEELEKLYRQASDPIRRTRLQIIWLLAKGYAVQEVALVTGYRRGSIYKIVSRYNELGIEGLKDFRHQHPGPETLLSETQQALLWSALQEPPPDGGLWNGRKVADWMSQVLECPINPQRGWEYLRSFKMRLKVPRPAHKCADPIEQENWKKNSHRHTNKSVKCEDLVTELMRLCRNKSKYYQRGLRAMKLILSAS